MRAAILFFLLFACVPVLGHPPVSVVLDSKGNAYYSDLNAVWQVAPNGAKRIVVPDVHTHELYLDAHDNLYGEHLWYEGERTDKWGHYVWKRDAAGRVTIVKPRTEGFLTNYSFVRDRAGNMYWASLDRKSVMKGGRVHARGFRDIRWMNAMADGTVVLVDAGDVVRIAPDGRAVRLARDIAKTTLLRPHVPDRHAIMGIWFDRSGNVYVAHAAQGEVKRITPGGRVTVVAKSPLPWSPCGGAIAPNGELVLLEYDVRNAVRLRRVRMQ
jgi:hypothetical protein